jgi:K+-transporting ATPase ATPase C chain
MKNNIIPAIRLTLVCLVFFCGIYTSPFMAFLNLHLNSSGVSKRKTGYYQNLGQNFSSDQYFWSRPSAVNYNAAGSGGSNKGPSNPAYLAEVASKN